MLLRVFAVALALSTATPTPELSAWNRPIHGSTQTVRVVTAPPEETFNEFLPEERGLGDCISAVQKPGCGSEARGGWRQATILLALVVGLGFIAWRIVRGSRLARLSRTPDATTVPDDPGDDPAP